MGREKGGRTPILGPNYVARSRRQKKALLWSPLLPPRFLAFSSATEKHAPPRPSAVFEINSFCFLCKFSPNDVSGRS